MHSRIAKIIITLTICATAVGYAVGQTPAEGKQLSERWQQARQQYKDSLIEMEGEERFEGLQKFFAAVHRLTSERRLSRIMYLVEAK